MTMKKRTVLILAIILALGWSTLASQEKQDKYVLEYKIGAKDLLEISVFGLDSLNTTVRVSEEGTISLPLLGEIEVDGLTKAELEKKISQLLGEKYLQNPQVTVFIKEYQSKKISILGAVQKPGSYELLGRQTLLQIISEAGGLTKDAGKEIIIIRQLPEGASISLKILIEDLILKGDPKLNIPLEPSDIVNIPVDQLVLIYVFGQVRNPGTIQVLKSNIPTLLRAIAQVGGFTERASRGGVLVRRKDSAGNEREIKINVKDILRGKKKDFQLEENDVVFVPETIF
jgi:polysaccharide export outer membrane protein